MFAVLRQCCANERRLARMKGNRMAARTKTTETTAKAPEETEPKKAAASVKAEPKKAAAKTPAAKAAPKKASASKAAEPKAAAKKAAPKKAAAAKGAAAKETAVKEPAAKAPAAKKAPAKRGPKAKAAPAPDEHDETKAADDHVDDSDDADETKSTGKDEALPTGALVLLLVDDEDEVPVYSAAITGATADPVKDYLKQIGKVALLNAAEEVELAMRIEAGLFAEDKLANEGDKMSPAARRELQWVAKDGQRAKSHLLGANL